MGAVSLMLGGKSQSTRLFPEPNFRSLTDGDRNKTKGPLFDGRKPLAAESSVPLQHSLSRQNAPMAMQQPHNDNVPSKGLRAVARAQEPHRGRRAGSPSDIPLPGWKDIILRVYQNIGRHRVIALAAAVAFYALLAIF
jgi:hypothetical protein